MLHVGRQVLSEADVDSIAAIGITNQRETTVVWERATGKPLANAIVWQDRRTAPLCAELAQEVWGAHVAEATGLVIDPYFSATKLAWLLRTVPGLDARARAGEVCFGTSIASCCSSSPAAGCMLPMRPTPRGPSSTTFA